MFFNTWQGVNRHTTNMVVNVMVLKPCLWFKISKKYIARLNTLHCCSCSSVRPLLRRLKTGFSMGTWFRLVVWTNQRPPYWTYRVLSNGFTLKSWQFVLFTSYIVFLVKYESIICIGGGVGVFIPHRHHLGSFLTDSFKLLVTVAKFVQHYLTSCSEDLASTK